MYSVLYYVLGLHVYMYVISNTSMKGGMRSHIVHTSTMDNFFA